MPPALPLTDQLSSQRQFASEKTLPTSSSVPSSLSRYDSPKPRGGRGQSQPAEPLVGADRYEEILITRGKRSRSQLSLDKFGSMPG